MKVAARRRFMRAVPPAVKSSRCAISHMAFSTLIHKINMQI